MRILIVNPNTTVAMTEKIGRAGRAAAALGTELIVVNPADGPVSIEGYYDEAFSVPGLLAEIAKGDTLGVSAHIIACFDDTGLEAARSVALAPVIGIGEAAFHLASMLGHRFYGRHGTFALYRCHRKQPVEIRACWSLRQGACIRTAGSFTG